MEWKKIKDVWLLDTKLRSWLGSEFESFVNEDFYWIKLEELPSNIRRIWGFGVDLDFGEITEPHNINGRWIKPFGYTFRGEPEEWKEIILIQGPSRLMEVEKEIADEIRANRGFVRDSTELPYLVEPEHRVFTFLKQSMEG